ncbi:glycosyltransferase family 4 protein [Haloprofundus salilacus]|uniref:glycosyltransferase family 4 protein n=1 Tax=Haloprofundus salilacus TaxID=2876190 RepID=UPI001CC914AD|nr:glycosyltransferase family 4 protein [Haloprofundus salilacus]
MIQDDWWPRTGGGPVHVKELSIALAETFGHEIDIFTRALRQGGKRYDSTERFAGGKVLLHRLGPCTEYWNPLGRITSLATPIPHLYSGAYDIIHGHTFLPAMPTRLGREVTDASTVFTVHGTAITSGVGRDTSALSNIKLRIERKFVLDFEYDHVISVNNEHVGLLSKHHSNVTCIPNGVDIDRFSQDRDRGNDILFLGRLAPKKRVSDLIRAFALIEDEFPTSDLVIVGTGPEKDSLVSLATELDVDDRVRFEGRVSDEAVTEHYATAGLFVLPSVWEGHPLTLLEAWAAGTPVIASSVEGIEEFVDHEETGLLVPSKDPERLADALRYALENPAEALEWGRNARELAEREYSWKGVAERTHDLYQKIA